MLRSKRETQTKPMRQKKKRKNIKMQGSQVVFWRKTNIFTRASNMNSNLKVELEEERLLPRENTRPLKKKKTVA